MTDWYRHGLRFACTQCGDCCSGEPGAVWVNDAELDTLASHLGLSRDELERRYTRMLAAGRALLERFDGDCIFLDATTRRCTVYPARPVQCRTWPFWDQNVADEEAWQKTCEVCPGAGQGPLLSVEHIKRRLAERAAARLSR